MFYGRERTPAFQCPNIPMRTRPPPRLAPQSARRSWGRQRVRSIHHGPVHFRLQVEAVPQVGSDSNVSVSMPPSDEPPVRFADPGLKTPRQWNRDYASADEHSSRVLKREEKVYMDLLSTKKPHPSNLSPPRPNEDDDNNEGLDKGQEAANTSIPLGPQVHVA